MQTIYLDISNKGVIPCVKAKQGEVGRKFLAVISDAGVLYNPTGVDFSVWYEGDSGKGNYTHIGEKSAFSFNENGITVELISQMLTNAGNGVLCLVMNKTDGSNIASWNIEYEVESVPGIDSEEAKDYYTAFSKSVSELNKVVGAPTDLNGEIFNFYTREVVTGDGKVYPGNTANKGSHAQNFGTHADGEYSSARGWCSTASGGISDASGRETVASGYCAHAGGRQSEATGANTFAHGLRAKATSNTSFAIGEDTEASGYYAVASGFKTKASGTCSHTQGRETEAREYASSAQGRGTISTSRNQSVRGAYNIPDTPDGNGNGEFAEIVGGGKNANDRANIYTLDWDGNAEFAGKVYSGGVELAPGGYGLGENRGTLIVDLNTCLHNGWYYTNNETLNLPNNYFQYASVHVSSRISTETVQRLVSIPYRCEMIRYTEDGGITWIEEWINPPMLAGVEYRTTERYNGEPVYAKQVNTTLHLPIAEVGSSYIAHNISNFGNLVRLVGNLNNDPLPLIGPEGASISTFFDENHIRLEYRKLDVDGDLRFTIYYTKK